MDFDQFLTETGFRQEPMSVRLKMQKAFEAARQPIQIGLFSVQEADTVPFVHPEYGPGIFFTEDAILRAAPPAPVGGADEHWKLIACLTGTLNHIRACPDYKKLLGDAEHIEQAIAVLRAQESSIGNFEVWAKGQGLDLLPASEDAPGIEMLGFRTYRYTETEYAWRGWANKPSDPLNEGGSEPVACKRCGGSKLVDDGEMNGIGGVDFENGPIQCVKDCPDCAPPEPGPVLHSEYTRGWQDCLSVHFGQQSAAPQPVAINEGGKGEGVAWPFPTPGALCKGSVALGSGCGICERCRDEKARLFAGNPKNAAPQPSAKALTDEQILSICKDFFAKCYVDATPSDWIGLARALLAAEQPSEDKRDKGGV